MATLTKEQVEQKMQQLKQLTDEMKALTKELAEAGAIELSEEDLENVSGGRTIYKYVREGDAIVKIPIGEDVQFIPKAKPEPKI
jgi:type II secretory pathway component PulJ